MLNVSGHLLSTADVESVLIEHPLVAETAVVAHPHSIKGECLYCFVTLRDVSVSSHSFKGKCLYRFVTLRDVNVSPHSIKGECLYCFVTLSCMCLTLLDCQLGVDYGCPLR